MSVNNFSMRIQLNCLGIIFILLSSFFPVTAQTRRPVKKPTTTTAPKQTEPKPDEEPLIPEGGLPSPPARKRLPNEPLGNIVLLPLDDRPAVAQFAQLIGSIGDQLVVLPPVDLLGRFTAPGKPQKLREWLGEPSLDARRKQVSDPPASTAGGLDYSNVSALVVSIDMLVYGGLVASRTPETRLSDALERLEFLRWFKKANPGIPVYAFSTIMRVAPTASRATRLWRDDLARWAELSDRVEKANDLKLNSEYDALKKKLDQHLIDDYLNTRRRNLQVNLALLKLYEEKVIDDLVYLQDDAREFGPHRHDQLILAERIKSLGFGDDIPIYNGADEGALSLVSKAALVEAKQKVSIAVVYSSEASRKLIAPYEDHPLEFTVTSQIKAAGGRLVPASEPHDYTLYVNAPDTKPEEFEAFAKALVADLKSGAQVALADLLFPPPHQSGSDEKLIQILTGNKLAATLISYAAWNTAGNTLGTAIPAANMRILTMKVSDSEIRSRRAVNAAITFLAHRFAGDYLYHDKVRQEINEELLRPPAVPTDEFSDETLMRTERKVVERLKPLVESFLKDNFEGRTVTVGVFEGKKEEAVISQISLEQISLPWPRTFESTIILSTKLK